MASIADLLNPGPEPRQKHQQLPTPCSSRAARERSPAPPRQKKQKVSKDAAVFTRGKVRGDLRYPPCEYQDKALAEKHKVFEIHPMGHITEFPRHIPYNSEKKTFLDKTGRESFEVFQYTFKMPGEEKPYTVMWDYNIGLVRTTSLFRCNNYSKTAPARMLDANPGLREISHSITGGALAAQGYWMPFEAAKAIAATFCWKIRYALTPLFGVEFLSTCVPPDSVRFGRMIIDPEVIRAATITAKQYRILETNRRELARMETTSSYHTSGQNMNQGKVRKLQPKYSNNGESENDGDESDTSQSRHYSPRALPNCGWTPANTPQTTGRSRPRVPSPRDILVSLSDLQCRRTSPSDGSETAGSASTRGSRGGGSSSPSRSNTSCSMDESDIDGDSMSDSSMIPETRMTPATTATAAAAATATAPTDGRNSPLPLTNDARAAYMLMRLHMQEAVGNDDEQNRKRRRASA